jgi:hypothetical protein
VERTNRKEKRIESGDGRRDGRRETGDGSSKKKEQSLITNKNDLEPRKNKLRLG